MIYNYKGKEYTVQTGTRGGQFFIDENNKKHYLKNENAKPRKKKEKVVVIKPKQLMDYTIWIDVYNKDWEQVDDFKEWTPAYSEEEALDIIRHDHPDRSDRHYKFTIYKIKPHTED